MFPFQRLILFPTTRRKWGNIIEKEIHLEKYIIEVGVIFIYIKKKRENHDSSIKYFRKVIESF